MSPRDLRAAHHARPRKHGIVYRVGLNVAAPPYKFNLDYNEIMDVF
jgi:hypothetical protein